MGHGRKNEIFFSEIHAKYKRVYETNNKYQERWVTLFEGIVFKADFNKNFNGITLVRPKKTEDSLSTWILKDISIFSSSNKELVQLENPEFDKEFITYSTDQVEARYILTPVMMECICELNNKCTSIISLSFIGSSIFIAFPLNKNYFEPPMFQSLLDPAFLNEDIDMIHFMYNIVQELNLNTRIWTKF